MNLPDLYAAVEALTKQHDQIRMAHSFLEILTREFSAERATIYEVHFTAGQDKKNIPVLLDVVSKKTIPLDFDEKVSQAYKTQEFVIGEISEEGLRHCIYPLTIGRKVFGLTDIMLPKLSNKVMDQLGFMINLYTNLSRLIYKKERDGLTGLLNRLDFEERLHRIFSHNFDSNRRSGKPDDLCVAIFDIDNFKKVNDQFGHLFGDEVLVHLSQLMGQQFRSQDLICRFGGEEFAVLLSGVNVDTALVILERFREAVQSYNVPQVGSVTISAGVVQVRDKGLLTSIIDQADKALYFSKEHGRNQVHAYEKLLFEGRLTDVSADTGDVELF